MWIGPGMVGLSYFLVADQMQTPTRGSLPRSDGFGLRLALRTPRAAGATSDEPGAVMAPDETEQGVRVRPIAKRTSAARGVTAHFT